VALAALAQVQAALGVLVVITGAMQLAVGTVQMAVHTAVPEGEQPVPMDLGALVKLAQFVSSGPEPHVAFHQPALAIFNQEKS
jgi:hypothetical protein